MQEKILSLPLYKTSFCSMYYGKFKIVKGVIIWLLFRVIRRWILRQQRKKSSAEGSACGQS